MKLKDRDINHINSLWGPIRPLVIEALGNCHKFGVEVSIDQSKIEYSSAVDFSSSCVGLHAFGIAFDIKLPNSHNLNDWELVGDMFESYGFTWGGRWPSVLQARHIQWDRGVGNKPRSFDRLYLTGGQSFLEENLLKPVDILPGDRPFSLSHNDNIYICHAVRGLILVPEELCKDDRKRYKIGDQILVISNDKFDFSYWPLVEYKSELDLDLVEI